tara:strand:+ start:87 stop:398 length:312 start_codon:yes stop_codon:yes gene_type:complete
MPRTQRSLTNNLTTLTTSSGSTSKKEKGKTTQSRRKTAPLVRESSDAELFPHMPRFKFAFFPGKKHQDRLNKAWFDYQDRLENHIRKHKLKQDEYTAYAYKVK